MAKHCKDSRNIEQIAYRATVSNAYGILFIVIMTACNHLDAPGTDAEERLFA